MTPEERQMIAGLFERMRQQGAIAKDRDAETLIRQGVQQHPDAPYMMVGSVLTMEMALQQQEARIRELEDQVQALQAQSQPAAQPAGSGSFLGGLFGGSRPAAPQPIARQQSAGFGTGSVPRTGSSPWGNAPGAQPAPMQQMPMQSGGGGGSFMRSAMATAAGVAGGMLAANAISNMMNGGSSAAHASPATPSAAPQSPAADTSSGYAGQDDDNDPGTFDNNDPGDGGDGGGWDE